MDNLAAESAQMGAPSTMTAQLSNATQSDVIKAGDDPYSRESLESAKMNRKPAKRGLKKQFDWPYVATVYVQSWVFMMACTYLMILYSISFTNSKANNWLLLSIVSMVCSVPLLPPLLSWPLPLSLSLFHNLPVLLTVFTSHLLFQSLLIWQLWSRSRSSGRPFRAFYALPPLPLPQEV